MSKKIIGLVGPIAAGKGTVAAYLAEHYQAKIYGFSTILRDIIARLHLEPSRSNLANLSTCLRAQFGQDLISLALKADIMAESADIIVLDGVRRHSDMAAMKDLSGFVLWAVNAEAIRRHERLIKRRQNSDDENKNFKQFLADEQSEADQTIATVMQSAQITINNNDDLSYLYKQIDEAIK